MAVPADGPRENQKNLKMQLVINTYGAYLRKKNDCFVVVIEDKEQEDPGKEG